MPDPVALKLVTISWDDDNGLEVDFDGMNAFEAWAYCWHATELLAEQIAETFADD